NPWSPRARATPRGTSAGTHGSCSRRRSAERRQLHPLPMASPHPERAAWEALVRTAFRRTWRGRLRVTDGPGRRRQAALWGLVHVLWAAVDLRELGVEVPLDDLVDLMKTFRRGAGFAAKPRTRRRYFDDNAWLGLVALTLPDPALASELL